MSGSRFVATVSDLTNPSITCLTDNPAMTGWEQSRGAPEAWPARRFRGFSVMASCLNLPAG
jgi:hypothetical protein